MGTPMLPYCCKTKQLLRNFIRFAVLVFLMGIKNTKKKKKKDSLTEERKTEGESQGTGPIRGCFFLGMG